MKIRGNGQVEFPNGALSGLILDYCSVESSGQDTEDITTTYKHIESVGTNELSVSFVAPPSGNVEIEFFGQLLFNDVTDGSHSIACFCQPAVAQPQQSPEQTKEYSGTDTFNSELLATPIVHKWVITGLTAGTTYNRYVITKGSASSVAKWIWTDQDETGVEYAGQCTLKATALGTVHNGL